MRDRLTNTYHLPTPLKKKELMKKEKKNAINNFSGPIYGFKEENFQTLGNMNFTSPWRDTNVAQCKSTSHKNRIKTGIFLNGQYSTKLDFMKR